LPIKSSGGTPVTMPSTSSSTTVAFVVSNIIVVVAATLSVVAVVYYKTTTEKKKSSSSSSSSSDDTVTITLPPWATAASAPEIYNKRYTTDEEMMTLAIELSRRNVKEGTGGPFGAAIFERIRLGNNSNTNNDTSPPPIEEDDYCRLVSVGMNRVVPLNNSTLHGEMVAIQLAQQQLQTFSLNGSNNNDTTNNNTKQRSSQYELFTSCEPCAMCIGGILWSGVSRLVCAATKDDAQSIGFDEGPVTAQSYVHLEDSGCVVTRNVLRNEAREVLYNYGKTGVIYNGSVRSGGHLLRTHLMS